MTRTHSINRIVELAFGGLPSLDKEDVQTPELWCHSGVYVGDYKCSALPLVEQAGARALVLRAWEFAMAWFPFGMYVGDPRTMPLKVTRIELGRVPGGVGIVSASSPQCPGVIQLGVPDAPSHTVRVSSLLVHESMHQALYLREMRSRPFLENAVGYSPWKKRPRSARLLWHSWWTFASQYAFLIDALANDSRIIEEDPGLVEFTAARKAELEVALYSIQSCSTFVADEETACLEAAKLLDKLTEDASSIHRFADAYELAVRRAVSDLNEWVESLGKN